MVLCLIGWLVGWLVDWMFSLQTQIGGFLQDFIVGGVFVTCFSFFSVCWCMSVWSFVCSSVRLVFLKSKFR